MQKSLAESHSSFWLPESYFNTEWDLKSNRYLMAMGTICRSVGNFVQIVTGESIPVKVSSGRQSYTDGKTIVISAMENFDQLDSMVGLALHEGSHILLSQAIFQFNDIINQVQAPINGSVTKREVIENFNRSPLFRTLLNDFAILIERRDLRSRLMDSDPPNGFGVNNINFHKVWNDVHMMINVIEDRRIDSWMYENVGGFKGYYDALYDRYFRSEDVSEAMEQGYIERADGSVEPLDVPSFQNYQFHIINMTNPNFNPDALPGLREITEKIDLDDIRRFDSTMKDNGIQTLHRANSNLDYGSIMANLPELYRCAMEVTEIVYRNAEDQESDDPDEGPGENSENDFGDYTVKVHPGTGDGHDGLRNFGDYDVSDEDGEGMEMEDAADAREASKAQKQMVNGKAQKDRLINGQEEAMDNLESADADLRSVDDFSNAKVDVTVYRRVTPSMANSDQFPFKYPGSSARAYVRGVQMGRMLAHRLKVMAEESTTVYNRQRSGHLDKRRIAQLGVGENDVFSTTQVERYKPVMVDLSIDSSGSMRGHRWENAYSLAVALCHAATVNGKFRIRVNLRTTSGFYHNAGVSVAMIFDSDRDNMQDLRKVSQSIGPTGGTPEGLAFNAILSEILEDVKNTRRFFVNLSDGMPEASTGAGFYSGHEAAQHTRRQIQKIRSHGIQVLSYFITDNPSHTNREALFDIMYGRDARYIDTKNIGQIARTLNQMFLAGGA